MEQPIKPTQMTMAMAEARVTLPPASAIIAKSAMGQQMIESGGAAQIMDLSTADACTPLFKPDHLTQIISLVNLVDPTWVQNLEATLINLIGHK